jgi:predicted RNA-binding Zn-ribbon protein involved in translation (DUF1610 family)
VPRLRHTREVLEDAVKKSESFAGVLRYLNLRQAGGTHSYLKRKVKDFDIDTNHFTGQAHGRGKLSPTRKTHRDILVLRSEGFRQRASFLVRSMLEAGVKHECSKCGQEPEWLGNPLTLDVDHINENFLDDRLKNLRFLCPNCHSQFSRNLLKD